jgi:small conductance mechanosensitive channel
MLPKAETQALITRVDRLLEKSLDAAVYLAGALVVTIVITAVFRWLERYSRKLIQERGGLEVAEFRKQTITVALITRRVLVFSIWAVGLALSLKAFGFDVQPLLAGAGVVGIAVGFAAQNMLKDMIAGFFLLAEGQIRIGDSVTINGLSGAVEELSLRNTVMRGFDGAVHVISNGTILQLSNHTRMFAYAVFDLSVDWRDDPDRMAALLREITDELRAEEEFAKVVLEPLELLGVDRFAQEGVYVKARLKTVAGEQWRMAREVNRRLRQRSEAAGARLATAQRTVMAGPEGESGRGAGRSDAGAARS